MREFMYACTQHERVKLITMSCGAKLVLHLFASPLMWHDANWIMFTPVNVRIVTKCRAGGSAHARAHAQSVYEL